MGIILESIYQQQQFVIAWVMKKIEYSSDGDTLKQIFTFLLCQELNAKTTSIIKYMEEQCNKARVLACKELCINNLCTVPKESGKQKNKMLKATIPVVMSYNDGNHFWTAYSAMRNLKVIGW